MLVQGGKTFIGNQGAEKKQSQTAKNDSQSFQDLLKGAQKEKATLKKAPKKTYEVKKKSGDNDINDQQEVAKHQERPVKKKMDNPTAPGGTKINQDKVHAQEIRNQKLIEATSKEPVFFDKKFSQGGEEGTQRVDSLNLSGTEKNTLDKNQKLVQSLENSFEEMMIQNKGQSEVIPQKQGQTIKGLAGSQGLNELQGLKVQNQNNGKMKIDPAMKLSEGGETLQLDSLGETSAIKSLGKAEDTNLENSAKDLETPMNQFFEQDFSVDLSVDSKAFTEELTVAQGEGKSQKVENMNSIIKQAKAFVDDGGGTMEIHLQPEGLGKVHLKVAVQEGQVNIEMMADNQMAKKALEEGLSDIKNALEGQKLLVETLKVEMNQDYQKDFSDLQNHMQEQANRDFAEQFLGQFRQEREERMGGMFDAFRNFQKGSSEPELTLSRNPYTENGKGRSINLVA